MAGSTWWSAVAHNIVRGKGEKEKNSPTVPFKGLPPVPQRPPSRPHVLEVPPVPGSTVGW